MSTITALVGTDGITTANSMTKINTNFSNLNTDKVETSYLDTDTSLTANSDVKIATQKAVKAYVDASVNPTGRSWNEYAVDVVGTDSYAITVSGISAYVAGQTYKFKAGTTNTGACSLNVNALGAKTIKKDVSSDLATGDILASQIVEVTYDGTNMQMQSRSPVTYLNVYKSGIATKDMADASTTQTIAHGLGVTPTSVRVRVGYSNDSTDFLFDGNGSYDGNQKFIYTHGNAGTGTGSAGSGTSTSYAIGMQSGGNTNPSATGQTGTIAVDATNITITWTKNGSPTGTASFLWEAQY